MLSCSTPFSLTAANESAGLDYFMRYYYEYCSIIWWQQHAASPMPWIGMYIAAASLLCTLAMALDVFRAFWTKSFWYPCWLFTLNATTLTLLAVAMKLPVDITTAMNGYVDQLAKLSGSIFMNAVIGNFMTSLGCMNGEALMMNITAATILVVTIIVNVNIQLRTQPTIEFEQSIKEVIVSFFMFVLLLILIVSALTIPATKKYLEVKYHECLDEEQLVGNGKLTTEKLELAVKKLWMMAETSSPQFVMARSVTSTATGLICSLNAFMLGYAWLRWYWLYRFQDDKDSDYGRSTMYIVVIQSAGVGIGTISPVMRLFLGVSFKCSEKTSRKYVSKFNIEPYWTEKLREWKQGPLPLRIGGKKTRKFLQCMKKLILFIFITVQVVIVMVSKLVLLITVLLVSRIFSRFQHTETLKTKDVSEPGATDQHKEQESEPDVGGYVLLVEGEPELPKRTRDKILYEVDRLIQTRKKHQPKDLLGLLKESRSFNGFKRLGCIQVPSIFPEEPPNCWTLPVVTLTSISIAIASPNVGNQLISQVSGGIRYAIQVDKSLEGKRNSGNIINAAEAVWGGVEDSHYWLDENLMAQKFHQAGNTSKEILQMLSKTAEKILKEFKDKEKGSLVKNPSRWPVHIVAANSMYRICKAILLMCPEVKNLVDNGGLFNNLSIMIKDILFACLTNLPHVIIHKGRNTMIEEREESIRHAAQLVGETEDILKLILEGRAVLDPHKAVDIDKWLESFDVEAGKSDSLRSIKLYNKIGFFFFLLIFLIYI